MLLLDTLNMLVVKVVKTQQCISVINENNNVTQAWLKMYEILSDCDIIN